MIVTCQSELPPSAKIWLVSNFLWFNFFDSAPSKKRTRREKRSRYSWKIMSFFCLFIYILFALKYWCNFFWYFLNSMRIFLLKTHYFQKNKDKKTYIFAKNTTSPIKMTKISKKWIFQIITTVGKIMIYTTIYKLYLTFIFNIFVSKYIQHSLTVVGGKGHEVAFLALRLRVNGLSGGESKAVNNNEHQKQW